MMLRIYLAGECPVLSQAEAAEVLSRLRILFALDTLGQLLGSAR